MSVWRARARERIAELTANLPADATRADHRRALWGKGWDCGWAQKVWRQEVRVHLDRIGPAPDCKRKKPAFPDHVHFPFRGEAHGES